MNQQWQRALRVYGNDFYYDSCYSQLTEVWLLVRLVKSKKRTPEQLEMRASQIAREILNKIKRSKYFKIN